MALQVSDHPALKLTPAQRATREAGADILRGPINAVNSSAESSGKVAVMAVQRPPEDFQTERLFLRPINEGDAEAVFFGYASCDAATRFMDWPRHTKLEQSISFVGACMRAWKDNSAFPWAVLKQSTGEFIGCIELRVTPPKADFGYIFCERFWQQGFGAEAAAAVVNWAFAQPDIFRVWAACSPENVGSARVLEKAGLKLEARLENWAPRPQRGLLASPSLVFSKTKAVPARS